MSPQMEAHGMGKISLFFSVNKPLSILILLSVVVFGVVAFLLTPKQYNPEIVRPAFAISFSYQGASIEDTLSRVVYELVEKIQTVPGVDEVLTEIRDGTTIHTTVIFEVGFDATEAKLDLLSQLDQHSYLAKGFITKPHIVEINPETIPILQVVFSSHTDALAEVRDKVNTLSHRLTDVSGVSELSVYGGYSPAVVVALSPEKLSLMDVTVDEMRRVLTANQIRMVSDGLHTEEHQVSFVFDGRLRNTEEVSALLVKDGVRVRDVAEVYEGTTGDRSYLLYHREGEPKEVVALSVAKTEGKSAPRVTEALLSALDAELERDEFRTLNYQVVSNDGETATNEIYGLTKNLITSILIVAGVLFLFLSSRAAFVVLVAIPVTLLIVFGLGYLFDQTINRITLFALILSLGLLVDSAIVVVENIHTHLRKWRKGDQTIPRECVIANAVQEIGVGLLLSTVTSVIVFLPMMFITGMMGPYMGPVAFFVPTALIVSFLVAIIITPFIASHSLHKEDRKSALTQIFSRLLTKITGIYTHVLGKILCNRRTQKRLLVGALGAFLISILLPVFALVHFQMLPRADRDQVYVYMDFPVDTNVETARKYTKQISNLILEDEMVLHTQQFVATNPILDFNGMFKGAEGRVASYQSTMRVNLVPGDERRESSTDITTRLRTLVSEQLSELSPYVRFIEEPPGPPVLATFVAKVSANERDTQRVVTQEFLSLVLGVEGVVDPYTTEKEQVVRIRYEFDHEIAASYGVLLESVTDHLALIDGVEITELVGSSHSEYTPVILGLTSTYQSTVGGIETIKVPTIHGEYVALGAALRKNHEVRPSQTHLYDATLVSYVTAEVEGRSIVYVVIDVIRTLLKDGVGNYVVIDWSLFDIELQDPATKDTIHIVWGGEWEMTLENFRDLGVAMGVALMMVYGILVAQYRKFAVPAYILVTVPLGLVGILWGFLLLDSMFSIYLTATALIGFIALIGIVVNNAIIFLEYVEQMKQRGHEYKQALLEAGQARLRPILLTSMTTVLGSLTIAGDPVWSGLAWAIVFGLSISTVLTLVIYPTLLVYFTHKDE